MALILSVDTSTPVSSVAITKDGETLASEKLFVEKSHATSLTVVIESLVKHASIPLSDLDAFAVSEGPGSYTGLRIGVSTIKGLSFALDKPMIAVSTLRSMAFEVLQFNPVADRLVPMLDARRMEVYTAEFDDKLNVTKEIQAMVLGADSFVETLSQFKVLFFGDGSEKFKLLVEGNKNAIFIDNFTPSAWAIGKLASEKFIKRDFVDLAYFEPFYLKEYQATKPKKLL